MESSDAAAIVAEAASEPAAISNQKATSDAASSDASPQPPPKKSGFKGKRRRPKFTRNARTGAQKKDSETFRSHQASQVSPLPNVDSSRSARRKPSNTDLKGCLQHEKAKNRALSRENEVVIAKNNELKNKNEKQRGAVAKLAESVRGARARAREACKKQQVAEKETVASDKEIKKQQQIAEQQLVIKVNDHERNVMSMERQHQQEVRNAKVRNIYHFLYYIHPMFKQ